MQEHCLTKNLRIMTQFNKISDEELAAYLDGIMSDNDSSELEANMDIDTLEVLNVSRKALSELNPDNVVTLPFWENIAASPIQPLHNPFALAGFLGDCNEDESKFIDNIIDEESSKESDSSDTPNDDINICEESNQ